MNVKTRICFLIILLLVASSNASLWAQSLVERFDRIDRDRDGKVSREETANAPWFDRLLRRMDRNRNGVLERNEIAETGLQRKADDSKICDEPAHTEHLDIRYAEIEGVDPNLLSLDLYVPNDAKGAPVMMWLHGGSWQVGDKGGTQGSPMRNFFLSKGWIFASINYRLTPEGRHPANAEDVASAIAWLHDNIAEFGGSPEALYLIGHSAGGHLAAIVTANGRFLKATSKSSAILNAVLLLDPAVLNVPQMLNGLSRNSRSPYTINFGTDPDQWIDASPFHHVRKDNSIPPVILLLAYGQQNKVDQALATSAALREIGVRAELIDAFSYKSHAAIAREFGLPDDLPTETAWRFLQEIEISRRSGTRVSRGLGDHHVMKPSEAVRLAGRREIGEYQSQLLFKHLDQDRDGRLALGETREPIRQHFSALDQNGDRYLVEAEIIPGYTAGPLMPELPTTEEQGSEESAATTSQTPAETCHAFTNLKFTRDFVAGKDRHGEPMGGTECNYIVSHKEKLWASLSCWKHDTSAAPLLGPQILLKRSADADWELDFCFGPDYGTSKILKSISFTTDRHGRELSAPVSMLVADSTRWRPPYDVGIWTRDDTTGKWIRTIIAPEQHSNSVYTKGFSTEVRMIIDHFDNVTGIHYIFACTNQGKIHRGAYDSSVPGCIAWEKIPELDNRLRRTSSGGEANGDLYVSIGMDASDPDNGGLFRRIDGREPFWKRVAGWPHHESHQERKLTSELRFSPIPNPDEESADILLATQAHPVNRISRIYPDDDFRMAVDLDVQDYVSEHIPGARVMSIAANGFASFQHPDTGEQVHLGGLWLYFRNQADTQDSNAAWYLVRYEDGTYRHGRIFDPNNPIPNRGIPGGLRDARTICASPFPEDHGRVLYFGGFNCGTHYIKENLLNTAWIYKGTMPTKPIHESRP